MPVYKNWISNTILPDNVSLAAQSEADGMVTNSNIARQCDHAQRHLENMGLNLPGAVVALDHRPLSVSLEQKTKLIPRPSRKQQSAY